MTRARDLANFVNGIDASKITSGTFADARIAASNVSQHAQSFDDNKIVNDISTLGLRVHTQENLNVSNTNSASFDVFNDANGITNLTNCSRDSAGEFVASVYSSTVAADAGGAAQPPDTERRLLPCPPPTPPPSHLLDDAVSNVQGPVEAQRSGLVHGHGKAHSVIGHRGLPPRSETSASTGGAPQLADSERRLLPRPPTTPPPEHLVDNPEISL